MRKFTRNLHRQRLAVLAGRVRRDCEWNKPETCTYCVGVSPACQLVPTKQGKMHNKCAEQIGLNVYWEIDHA